MRQEYGDNCLSRAQIFRWYARFESGVETIEDEARPGRPFSARNEGLIAEVGKWIQEERCVSVIMMADEFSVNREMIRQNLVQDFGKTKVRKNTTIVWGHNRWQLNKEQILGVQQVTAKVNRCSYVTVTYWGVEIWLHEH